MASNLDSSLKGQYQVTVNAQDGTAPQNTAQTVLTVSFTPRPLPGGSPAPCPAPLTPAVPPQIFTVDQSYRIRLQFSKPVEEVQSNLENIKT